MANNRGLEYLGLDISKSRVDNELQKYGGPDILCDAHSLPVRDQSIDAVYTIATWEHLAFPHISALEAARVLKPGGYHMGTVSFLEPGATSGCFHMSPLGVYIVLAMAGLNATQIWPSVEWNGFKAILSMGNKATSAISGLGHLVNAFYLAPEIAQAALRHRRIPSKDSLIESHARVSGATTWIARKSQ